MAAHENTNRPASPATGYARRVLPAPTNEAWAWQHRGRCRDADPDLFSEDGERGPSRLRRQQAAKAICMQRPVMAPCREHSLRVPEVYGIWGGTSEVERFRLLGGMTADASRSRGVHLDDCQAAAHRLVWLERSLYARECNAHARSNSPASLVRYGQPPLTVGGSNSARTGHRGW
jgi:WhiB family redox-sensing transcriptional regulator